MSTRQRPIPNTAQDASRTIVLHDAQPREQPEGSGSTPNPQPTRGVLRLRGGPRNTQRVLWREDVVDNEGCGKKKSKICCIYHKPKRFDESSDESSDDSDCDHSSHSHRRRQPRDGDAHSADSSSGSGAEGSARVASTSGTRVHHLEDSDSEPNAYEAQPSKKFRKQRS